MRGMIVVFGAIVGAFLPVPIGQTGLHAQVPVEREWKIRSFASYAWPYRVTIYRNGTLLTRLEIPKGVYLSVYSTDPRAPGAVPRFEYHGDVMIRARPRSEVDSGESGNAEVMMEKAPLIMTAQSVDVVVERR